jgi:putative transposase
MQLKGQVQVRCRDLLRQTCDSLDIQILKGVVSNDNIHLHLSYPPKICVSEIVKRLKGRSARILLDEFGELRKRYLGSHFWGIGYGVQDYLEHHKEGPNGEQNIILE